ncbi:MAG: hypothetical protein LUE97_06830, partial [Oscillospiraceae bacterium]|nr:hypothetical protein [Oscillospiraceae bacterium]
MKLLTKNHAKKAIGIVLAATMAFSVASASVLATSDATVFPVPTTTMTVDDSIMTTMSQRAATEIPLVFGLNVVGGNMFTGTIDMGGTSVNTSPDPYVWNYNLVTGDSTKATDAVSAGGYYNYTLGSIGNTGLVNADGLYSSGGGNQVYAGSTDATRAYKTYYYQDEEEILDVGFAVGERTDVIVGFNSALLTQIDAVRTYGEEDGDSSYNPLIIDVQTGSATSRMYAWSEMGDAISTYISKTSGNATRYTDAATIAQSIEDFSAGIPYYIASLIASEKLTKKTMAYVTA